MKELAPAIIGSIGIILVAAGFIMQNNQKWKHRREHRERMEQIEKSRTEAK